MGTTKVSQLETRCAADDDDVDGMMLDSPYGLSLPYSLCKLLGGCLTTSLEDRGWFSVNFIEFSSGKNGSELSNIFVFSQPCVKKENK